MLKKILIYTLIFLGLLVVGLGVKAGNYAKQDVYLPSSEVIAGNYYNAGETAEIAGKVGSDLYIAAGNVVITGEVGGDVFAIGGNIRITGKVNGNVRAVGGTVDISGPVGKNVAVAAGTLVISSTSNISGHVSVLTGALDMRGAVAGNVDGVVGDAILAGTVKGATSLKLDRDGTLKIRETAILGSLNYKSKTEAEIATGATINGEIKYDPYTFTKRSYGINWLGWLISVFSLIVVALVFVTLLPKLIKQISAESFVNPWKKIGWGLVWLIVTPIASIILLVTIIGMPLALIILVGYFVGLYLTQVFVGVSIAEFLKTKSAFGWLQKWPWLLSITLGIIIFKLVVSIPVIGWLVYLLGITWLWGTIIKVKIQLIRSYR